MIEIIERCYRRLAHQPLEDEDRLQKPYQLGLIQKPRFPVGDNFPSKPSLRPYAQISTPWRLPYSLPGPKSPDQVFNEKAMKEAEDAVNLMPCYERCEGCFRFTGEVEELARAGKTFFYCSKCVTLSPPRYHPFCSQDCFKATRKLGGHKIVCGKKYSDLPLSPLGFCRGPENGPLSLELQLLQLSTKPIESSRSIPSYRFYKFPDTGFKVLHEGFNFTSQLEFINIDDSSLSPQVKGLLQRATETRSEADLKRFLLLALEVAEVPKTKEWKHAVIAQISQEWDIEEDLVKEWIPW